MSDNAPTTPQKAALDAILGALAASGLGSDDCLEALASAMCLIVADQFQSAEQAEVRWLHLCAELRRHSKEVVRARAWASSGSGRH